MKAETAYYAQNVEGLSSQVRESEAALRFQERQMADQIAQAESTLASTEAQAKAAAADLDQARVDVQPYPKPIAAGRDLAAGTRSGTHGRPPQRRASSTRSSKQAEALRAAVALARSNAEQVSVRRSQVKTSEHMQAAAAAQRTRADVRLKYTEVKAPSDGVIDVRAVREGEFVNPGQAIATLINLDDLWVRVDVEESYIDRIRIGDQLMVRLPSGIEREGHHHFPRRRCVLRDPA